MIQSWKLGLAWLVMSGAIVSANCASAQITPDTTLGNENSTVTSTGSVDAINGGATRGANLLHSFQEFNVGEGRSAYFSNPSGIENILSRVTGGNLSQILGKLGVLGNANLFLINPNGIIFGQNASLDVRGSFVGTTASGIGLTNGDIFSANPQAPLPTKLLSVNPNALLFNQIRAASIENNSVANAGLNPSSIFTATGLRVPDGNSLLLVGGDINMNGGILNAFGGRVELGGLATTGTVGLNGDSNNLSLSFPNSVERSNVFLSNGAGVRVTADAGGSIAVNAQNLEMTGESFLFAGIESGLGSDNSKAGNIEVNATGAINLNNESSIANDVLAKASGQGGDVNITASTLRVEGGAKVRADTFASGKGGNLRVDAQDVQLIGSIANPEFSSGLYTFSGSNSIGDAGDLTIKTNTLLVKNGAQVGATTFGEGKGGNLRVDAIDVQLIGTSADSRVLGGLTASAQPNSTGDAGNLTIKTNTLLVKDGAQVSAATFGSGKGGNLRVDAIDVQLIGRSRLPSGLFASAETDSTGDAGNLTIKTNTLLVKDGAQVNAVAFDEGKGGNLTVEAIDVQLIGTSADSRVPGGLFVSAEPNSTGDAGDLTIQTNTLLVKDGAQVGTGTFGEGKGGNLRVDAIDVQLIGKSTNGRFASVLFASAAPNSIGDAGDLTIQTNTLLVQDGARVTVQSLGTGTAGNLTIDDARSIRLNNSALLSASTRSTKVDRNREQATINIDSQDLIMSRNSNIRTNATGENVIGGNINIDTDILVAIEDSNITADAQAAFGGRVNIYTQGIFRTADNDITASSELGTQFNGTVDINTPGIEFNSGLINLPVQLVEARVAQTCQPSRNQAQSEFVVTGRGGLPPSPDETLSTDAVQVDWVTLNPKVENRNQDVSTNITTPEPDSIVEATGLTSAHNGDVILTASATPVLPGNSWQTPAKCLAK